MEAEQTARERYLAEQQKINADAQALKDPATVVTDAEVDDLEDDVQEIDKHMGTETHVVTRQQHLDNKAAAEREAALGKMQAGSRNPKLSNEQRARLSEVVAKRSEISDPVLKHLIGQKAIQEVEFGKLKVATKEINERITKELMRVSNDLLKTQGVLENLDDQILKYVEGNPDSV